MVVRTYVVVDVAIEVAVQDEVVEMVEVVDINFLVDGGSMPSSSKKLT
jgi:hypothetical protein